MPDPAFIVGNSVASLVAALSGAEAGRPVTLFADLERAGGSFGGIAVGGRRVDVGVRLLELDYEGTDRRSIKCFRPETDGHRPFIDAIAHFVRDVCGDLLRRAADPEMWIEGRRIRCPLMTVDLSGLAAVLSPKEKAIIVSQARDLPVPGQPGEESLREASLARHGSRMHELLIASTCAKQWRRWSETMAAERRKLWAALFYPSTVCQAFSNARISFEPYRPFSMLESGQVFPFVHRLVNRVAACALIDLRPTPPPRRISSDRETTTFDFGSGNVVALPSARTAIGLAPEQLSAAAGIPFEQERIVSSIIWAEVPVADVQRQPSCLTIADPKLVPFRLSWAGSGMFCIEYGAASPTLEATREALEVTGCITPGAQMRLIHQLSGPAQPAPTAANRDRFDHALQRFLDMGFGGSLIGGVRQFGWGSLNDQIADGLYFGATQC